MDYKYMVLDFGGVLVRPEGLNYEITSKFQELIDINKIDMDEFNMLVNKYSHVLSEHVLTIDKELDMFTRFYDGILRDIKYPNYSKSIAEQIAYDRTYNINKYIVYDNVIKELTDLKKKYILLMLSDNWPCAIPYLKKHELYDFFDKIYISSIYGTEKKKGTFFDYPINDYNIKNGEALFIDDREKLLDVAKTKGFDVMQMDRENVIKRSRHKIIHNLEFRD